MNETGRPPERPANNIIAPSLAEQADEQGEQLTLDAELEEAEIDFDTWFRALPAQEAA
jgi:hypothetical protein